MGHTLLKVSKIHTKPPLAHLLLDKNSVSQPLGIKDLIDNPCLFQLIYLFLHCISTLFRGSPKLWLPWHYYCVYIKVMANKI